MAWVIQSMSEGPVLINDLGIMLHKNQMKDLDLIGRDNAERSNDLKILMSKNFISTLRKDPFTQASGIDAKALQEMQATAVRAVEAVDNVKSVATQASEAAAAAQQAVERQSAAIQEMRQDAIEQKEQTKAIMASMNDVLEAVKRFSEEHPREIRTIRHAIENIKVERAAVADQRTELQASEMSDAEIKMQDKILQMKDKKLEKNYNDLGKSVTKTTKDASVEDALSAMDELGIN